MSSDTRRGKSKKVGFLNPDVVFLNNENPSKILYKGRLFEEETVRVVLPYCWYETVYIEEGTYFRWAAYSSTWYMALTDMAQDVECSGTILETLKIMDDSVIWKTYKFI